MRQRMDIYVLKKFELTIEGKRTAGIGEGIARNLVSLKSNVIIAGRNAKAGEAIVQSFNDINPGGKHFFRPIDLSSISDTRRFSREFMNEFNKLHY